ncbi:MAG TPA: alpha/beta fold hydrolase [Polyangia bacterium]|nr:alpha/beta fold hydrolase [Polyangia bacterium]
MTPRRLGALATVAIALLLGEVATERIGAHAIVDAPNLHRADITTAPPERAVDVGPPRARLAVEIVDPKRPPRATIFVLHGIRDHKEGLRHWAEHLSEAGYRAVLVDSRGHGHSTGDWLTYGVQECKDLSQLADALAVDGPIGVMGISYGGATAIEWAAREPRVRAAVAVAPFASLRDIVPVYTPRMIPVAGWLIPHFSQMRAVDAAGRLGGFDPDAASPRAAAHATHTPILIIHGRDDVTVPLAQSQLIADGAPSVSLTVLDAQDHDRISGDPRLWPLALDFFARVFT